MFLFEVYNLNLKSKRCFYLQATESASAGVDGTDVGEGVAAADPPRRTLSELQMTELCRNLDVEWRRLAAKLGYRPDEILYYESSSEKEPQQAQSMLSHWFEDDEDASVDNLIYILEGLGLLDAAATLQEPVV